MAQPLVSIILPTYNGERFLRQSIESCLAQTFTNFELIVVNDCSTDGTLAIANEYAALDARVRVISNKENKKLPLSLNAGFDAAQGTYFTWTSDDNYYAPQALETLVKTLETHPEIDLVYTDYLLVNDENRVFGTRRFGNINESFTKWLGCGACFLYKRTVHEANRGYNAAAFLIEDYEFFVRAFTRFRFLYLPVAELYYYREHEGSLTAQHHAIVNDMAKIFLERNLAALEQKLTPHDLALLYRKLAVFYGGTKATPFKYRLYLAKLKKLSLAQALIVIFYVPVLKLKQLFQMLFTGLGALLPSK